MTEFVGKILPGVASATIGCYALAIGDDLPISAVLIAGFMVFWGISVAYPEGLNLIDDIISKIGSPPQMRM